MTLTTRIESSSSSRRSVWLMQLTACLVAPYTPESARWAAIDEMFTMCPSALQPRIARTAAWEPDEQREHVGLEHRAPLLRIALR